MATDPRTAATLLPGLPMPAMRALTTLLLRRRLLPPIDEPILLLDGDRREIIANTVVLSNAAPEYAPPGRALIAASVVGSSPDDGAIPRRTRPPLRHPHRRLGPAAHRRTAACPACGTRAAGPAA